MCLRLDEVAVTRRRRRRPGVLRGWLLKKEKGKTRGAESAVNNHEFVMDSESEPEFSIKLKLSMRLSMYAPVRANPLGDIFSKWIYY